ncbi:MAG: DUF11 domain-containing protein, partial [Chloroflexi bacterium]|nr:DUF11 domain-containing protein [Chloroflexota bacterium]
MFRRIIGSWFVLVVLAVLFLGVTTPIWANEMLSANSPEDLHIKAVDDPGTDRSDTTDIHTRVQANPLTCEPVFYQVIMADLKKLDPNTGTYTLIGTSADRYNSMGWDIRTNWLYALGSYGTSWENHLLKIGDDGVAQDLGVPVDQNNEPLSGRIFSGDMDRSGHLYVRRAKDLIKIDVDTNTYEVIIFSSEWAHPAVADIVYIPSTNAFWGALNNDLYKWDLNTLTVYQYPDVEGLPDNARYGAAYLDQDENLYVSNNDGGVYRIDDYQSSPKAVYITDSEPTNRNDGASCPLAPAPFKADLSLSKAPEPATAAPGEVITFTLTLTNDGPNTGTNVEVTDVVPDGYTYVAASIGGDAGATGATITSDDSNAPTLKWTVDELQKQESVTLTFRALINNSGTYTNTAEVTASDQPDPDSTPNNGDPAEDDYAVASVNVVPKADLGIAISDTPDPVNAGDPLTYTLTVSNTGPSDAETITVTLDLPSGVTYEGASGDGWTCSESGGTVTCTRPNVPAGTTVPGITVNTTVNSDVPDGATLTADAEVDSATPDPNPDNNTDSADTTVQTSADLGITIVDTPDPVNAGDPLTYTLTVSNTGPSDAKTITVTLDLPSGVTYDGASGDGWTCSESGGTVTCTRPNVPAGTTVPDITVNTTVNSDVPSGTTLSADATVASATPDPNPDNNSDTASTDVRIVSLALSKEASTNVVLIGDIVTFTVRITNTGETTIAWLPLRDAFDNTCLQYDAKSANPVENNRTDETIDWYDLTTSFGEDLAPGESFTVTIPFRAVAVDDDA